MRLCLRGFAQHAGVHKVENNIQARAHPRSQKVRTWVLDEPGCVWEPLQTTSHGNHINSLKGQGKKALEG